MSEYKKITIIDALGEAVYFDGELALRADQYKLHVPYLLRLLGFEVEEIRSCWEDLPKTDDPTKQPYHPVSLKELKKHLKEVERKKRKESIKRCKEELILLQVKEAEDHD